MMTSVSGIPIAMPMLSSFCGRGIVHAVAGHGCDAITCFQSTTDPQLVLGGKLQRSRTSGNHAAI